MCVWHVCVCVCVTRVLLYVSIDIPKMNGEAEGRIEFTTQRKIKSASDIREYDLMKGTLTLDKVHLR